jgi:hypothetical protein
MATWRYPSINGKDGVAGSIPAGSSTTKRQARPGLVPGLWHARRGPNLVAETNGFGQLTCDSTGSLVAANVTSSVSAKPREPLC